MNKGDRLIFELVEGFGCKDCVFYSKDISCSYIKGLDCSHGYVFKLKGVKKYVFTEDNK